MKKEMTVISEEEELLEITISEILYTALCPKVTAAKVQITCFYFGESLPDLQSQ